MVRPPTGHSEIVFEHGSTLPKTILRPIKITLITMTHNHVPLVPTRDYRRVSLEARPCPFRSRSRRPSIRFCIKNGKESQKTCEESNAKSRRFRVTSAVADVRQVRPVRERKVLVHCTRWKQGSRVKIRVTSHDAAYLTHTRNTTKRCQ